MRESVENDFNRYQGAFEQLYKQRCTKRLVLDGLLVCLLVVGLSVVPMLVKIALLLVLGPVIVSDGFQVISAINNRQDFINKVNSAWQNQIENFDWAESENRVYEDENTYYMKKDSELLGISKKGSRTLPSEMRGISLIIGENTNFFAKEQPIFIIYCDTTEIKTLNLTKQNEATLAKMKWNRVKNRILRPIGMTLLLILVLLYLFRII